MIGTFRGEDAQPTAVFNNIIEKMGTEVSMALYTARFVEVRERGYTLLPDFTNPSNPDLFRDFNLLFGGGNDVDRDSGHKWSYFKLS